MDNWKNHTVQEPWKSLSDAWFSAPKELGLIWGDIQGLFFLWERRRYVSFTGCFAAVQNQDNMMEKREVEIRDKPKQTTNPFDLSTGYNSLNQPSI